MYTVRGHVTTQFQEFFHGFSVVDTAGKLWKRRVVVDADDEGKQSRKSPWSSKVKTRESICDSLTHWMRKVSPWPFEGSGPRMANKYVKPYRWRAFEVIPFEFMSFLLSEVSCLLTISSTAGCSSS